MLLPTKNGTHTVREKTQSDREKKDMPKQKFGKLTVVIGQYFVQGKKFVKLSFTKFFTSAYNY